MSPRLLPAAAILLLVGIGAGVVLKVRHDEALFAVTRSTPSSQAPTPSMPAGIDGRPLDPTASMLPPPPSPNPQQRSAPQANPKHATKAQQVNP